MGSFFTRIIRAYRPIKTFNYIVNRSRLFNSIEAAVNIVMVILRYSIFSATNQNSLIHIYLGGTFLSLIGDYIVQISPAMRFMYSVILNSAVLIFFTVMLIILIVRTVNLSTICDLLNYYYTKYDDEDPHSSNVCKKQQTYYISWIILEAGIIALKSISIYFAVMAHNFVKNKKMVRAHKKRKAN